MPISPKNLFILLQLNPSPTDFRVETFSSCQTPNYHKMNVDEKEALILSSCGLGAVTQRFAGTVGESSESIYNCNGINFLWATLCGKFPRDSGASTAA